MSKESNPNSPAGYGLSQWGGARTEDLTAFAGNNSLSPPSLASSQGFLQQELSSDAKGSIDPVKGSSGGTAEEAAAAFDSNSSESDNSGGSISSDKGSSGGTVKEASAAFDLNSSESDNSGGDA
ncbi:hypothetical protein FB451DRAFT_1414352 [Mycena latifolia]|nr:hypothetical protein FB451DRAFT_1414352 [Mycena latifolia]